MKACTEEQSAQTAARLLQAMACREIDYSGLPIGLRREVADYIDRSVPPGGFIRAILCNDLMVAVLAADPDNARRLAQITRWFVDHAPVECWGDAGRVADWLRGEGRWEKD